MSEHPFDQSFLPIMDEAFARHDEKVYLQFGSESYSYRQVDELSAQCAQRLREAGFEEGSKGAVYSLNSALSFIAALGLLRAGGVWIPVNPRNAPKDNVDILTKFGCEALFFQQAFAEPARQTSDNLGGLAVEVAFDPAATPDPTREPDPLFLDWIEGAPTLPPPTRRQGRDTLTIPMTGGTTGLPKGVMLSHRNLSAINHAMTERYGDRKPVILCAAPMTHVGGRIALTSMTAGARCVILDKVDPQVILEVIEKERITDFFLPPTAIYTLIEQPNLHEFDLSSLVTLSYGSAPMPVERIKRAIERIGPVLRGGYGQTECPMFISTLPTEEHFLGGDPDRGFAPDEVLGSVGHATAISEIAIMSDDGELLGPHESGEVVVRGPMVSEGYYEAPEETAKVRRGGWHLTGDIGFLDENGYLTLVDRKKDMIITGGFNVYSAEVEKVLMELPGVALAAVFGIPDETWGEAVHAVVVRDPQSSASAEALLADAKERLGGVKTPKKIDFADELPRTAALKIDKKALRAPYWEGRARQV